MYSIWMSLAGTKMPDMRILGKPVWVKGVFFVWVGYAS